MTEPATNFPYRTALIVGAGAGISASLARRLSGLAVKVGPMAFAPLGEEQTRFGWGLTMRKRVSAKSGKMPSPYS